MDLTDELARLQRRMEELQAETERLTRELERLGQQLDEDVGADSNSLGESESAPENRSDPGR